MFLSKHLLCACRKFLANLSAIVHVHLTNGICAGSVFCMRVWQTVFWRRCFNRNCNSVESFCTKTEFDFICRRLMSTSLPTQFSGLSSCVSNTVLIDSIQSVWQEWNSQDRGIFQRKWIDTIVKSGVLMGLGPRRELLIECSGLGGAPIFAASSAPKKQRTTGAPASVANLCPHHCPPLMAVRLWKWMHA